MADDRVVEAVFAPEIADRAVAGGNAHAYLECLFKTSAAPDGAQLLHSPLHGYGHPCAGDCIRACTTRHRVSKESQNRIADEFAYRCTVLQRDFGHFREILIK